MNESFYSPASLISAMIGIIFLPASILAIVFGQIALEGQTHRTMAKWAIGLGIFEICIWMFIISFSISFTINTLNTTFLFN